MNQLLDSPPTAADEPEMVHSYSYGAFGETNSGSRQFSFGYTGRWGGVADSRTGVLNWNRWYGPAPGRWLNRDMIGVAGGSNLFQYVGNMPISQIDKNGLCKTPEDCWAEENMAVIRAIFPDPKAAAEIGANAGAAWARFWKGLHGAQLRFPNRSDIYRTLNEQVGKYEELGRSLHNLNNLLLFLQVQKIYGDLEECLKHAGYEA